MPNWFKNLPITVKLAGIFLSIIILAGIFTFPAIIIPLLLIIATVGSLMRIFVYLVHHE